MKKLNKNITGVIMAGGKSSRMGTDKGLMNFNGKPMVLYTIELLTSIFDTVIISSNSVEYERFGLKCFPDVYKNCGPIGGLHTILQSLKTEFAFVISCDMPLVSTEDVIKIINHCNQFQIVIPLINNMLEPLCAIYSKTLLPEIEERIQSNRYKLADLVEHSNTKYIDFNSEKGFRNFNTKEDFLKQI